jgi:hypothetical protein
VIEQHTLDLRPVEHRALELRATKQGALEQRALERRALELGALRLELLLEQIKALETERNALLAAQQVAASAPAAMLLDFNGIGPEFAAVLWSEGLFRTSTIDARSLLMRAWRRHPGRADRSIANKGFLKPAIRDCGQRSSSSPGYGCAISRNRRWLCRLKNESRATAAVLRRRPSWRWRVSCRWRCGNM